MDFSILLRRIHKLYQAGRSTRLLRALLVRRVLAGTEHRHVFVPGLATVVDIGANRGQFALAVKRWAPEAKVIAFEPLPMAAENFRKVFRGDAGVTLHQTAIGPETGETIIHVSYADDSSSLLPISHLQEQLFPGTGEIRTEPVQVAPLSNYLAHNDIICPAMLKLDVQGYELEALRGCEELLPVFSYVYVECSFVELYSGQALVNDIIDWLRKRGWFLRGSYNMIYDRMGKSIQADFLFENPFFNDAA